MLMCTLAWHLYQTRKLLPFQIWHQCISKVKRIYSLSEWTGILVGKSLINSLWSPVNILFIINIQTSSTGWTYITLWGCFFFTCHNGCPVCKESRWKLKLGAREGAPGGLVPSPPQPLSPMKWSSGLAKGPVLHLVSAGGGFNTHNPSSHLPFPSCSGWCLNASMSHLGLPMPVLTAGGRGAAWSALTLDGNTVIQGLAGWLAEVQIILLIMHSGKQLPRTKGIQQTRNGLTSPATFWHASSVMSTSVLSNVSVWRLCWAFTTSQSNDPDPCLSLWKIPLLRCTLNRSISWASVCIFWLDFASEVVSDSLPRCQAGEANHCC